MQNIENIKKEINSQLEAYEILIKSNPVFDSLIKAKEIINQNNRLMQFYNREDTDNIIVEYSEIIDSIRRELIKLENSEKKNILNIYEYIRYMNMYENYKEVMEDFLYFATLSQSSISSVFLGKGVCAAQARLFRDLIPNPSRVSTVNFMFDDEPSLIKESHDVVLASLNDGVRYLDPTWYNGSRESLKGSNGKAKFYGEPVASFDASEEEILASRREVSNILISKLKIDLIIKELLNDEMNEKEKHCAIFTFIESHIIKEELDVSFSSASLNGYIIDSGKLMELFFIAANINHELVFNGNKESTLYKVFVDGQELLLNPPAMYNSKTGCLTTLLHIKNIDGKLCYLPCVNKEFFDELKPYIYAGRENAKKVNVLLTGENRN